MKMIEKDAIKEEIRTLYRNANYDGDEDYNNAIEDALICIDNVEVYDIPLVIMQQEEKEQFKQDVEMLMELAFDGVCIGQYKLDLLERIRTRLKEL